MDGTPAAQAAFAAVDAEPIASRNHNSDTMISASTTKPASIFGDPAAAPVALGRAAWNCVSPAWFVALCFVWVNVGLFA